MTNATSENILDQRLDALDRALLGMVSRQERLEFVSQLETRLRGTDTELESLEPAHSVTLANAATPRTRRRRSRLALSSGILGIVALTLLMFMPITYLMLSFTAEALGEELAISAIGLNVLAVGFGGLLAVVLGIAALVKLNRRGGNLVGHGWAISALCTGALPMLFGGLLVLVALPSLLALGVSTTSEACAVCLPPTTDMAVMPATSLQPATYYPASNSYQSGVASPPVLSQAIAPPSQPTAPWVANPAAIQPLPPNHHLTPAPAIQQMYEVPKLTPATSSPSEFSN